MDLNRRCTWVLQISVEDFAHKEKAKVSVPHSCLTLCDSLDYCLSGFSAHGTLQARILERVAIPFSWGSSRPRD